MYPKGPQKGTNCDEASLSRKGPQVSRRFGTVWDFPEGLEGQCQSRLWRSLG